MYFYGGRLLSILSDLVDDMLNYRYVKILFIDVYKY